MRPPTLPSPKVELRPIELRYFGPDGETEALNISLSIFSGEFVAIIGQSSCGKSSLLSLVSGILRPTAGMVLLDGQPLTGPTPKVGYMLRQDYLFEWRTILENAVLDAEIQGLDMSKARERAKRLLTDLIQYGSQIFKMKIVMTAIAILAICFVVDVSGNLAARGRGDAAALTGGFERMAAEWTPSPDRNRSRRFRRLS